MCTYADIKEENPLHPYYKPTNSQLTSCQQEVLALV